MKLISFEGSDYSGKTTISKLIAEKTSKENQNVVYNSGKLYLDDEDEFMREISKHCNELQREAIYTIMFFLDKKYIRDSDQRIILQDRYWMSVVAYGRFLNGEKSLHDGIDLSEWMIKPDAVIYLQCSLEEKVHRSKVRDRRSVLDKLFLTQPELVNKLELEIISSLKKFEKVLSIDTTNIPISIVADRVEEYLKNERLL